ncbi:hypothetical protein BJF79_05725 [Actinomadura sp. CNU-125]|uniref:hypothetical protein n=1 Tax=Actinomadura sp. CNU-125 TaxID=1904961 RepID=UPI00095AE1D7|nr:hypothetical protein [Actinomadura sp. CNU-125]OLT37711.1 hypothetical protein BJF79_05725 [Actinomadura sp. CNU-125]
MHKPTDYLLAVRTTGSPPAPDGVKTVDLVPGGEDDVVSGVIGGLRASGLTAADFRARVVFLAPEGPGALVPYAALCGFAGRRLDVYADGAVLDVSRLDRHGESFADVGRPGGFLMWAQVGGREAAGIPTVHVGSGAEPVTPEDAAVIRYAARLRLVPPDSARAAFAVFTLVAALRRRADDRFPFLSTGAEPVPAGRNDPEQGIDLERLRREAVRYRQELRIARRGADVVPAVPASAHDARIAEADGTDVRTVLPRLGSAPGGESRWHCPRVTGTGTATRSPRCGCTGTTGSGASGATRRRSARRGWSSICSD